jgi:hypothetical protein
MLKERQEFDSSYFTEIFCFLLSAPSKGNIWFSLETSLHVHGEISRSSRNRFSDRDDTIASSMIAARRSSRVRISSRSPSSQRRLSCAELRVSD